MVIVQFASGKYAIKTNKWPGWLSYRFIDRNTETIWIHPENVNSYATFSTLREAVARLDQLEAAKAELADLNTFRVVDFPSLKNF